MSYYKHRRQGKYKAVRGWYDVNLQPTDKANGRWYFRSLLEVKCARYLNMLIRGGIPMEWRYGRKEMHNGHWDFNERVEKPFKTNSQYTLDFEVYHPINGYTYWIEVKGAKQGITKIRRAVKHFPERELRVFTAEHRAGTKSEEENYRMEPATNYLNRLDNQRSFKKTELPNLLEQVRKVRKEAVGK